MPKPLAASKAPPGTVSDARMRFLAISVGAAPCLAWMFLLICTPKAQPNAAARVALSRTAEAAAEERAVAGTSGIIGTVSVPPTATPNPSCSETNSLFVERKSSASELWARYQAGVLKQKLGADEAAGSVLGFPADVLTVVRRWARADSTAAVAWARGVALDEERAQAFAQIAGALVETDPSAALTLAKSLHAQPDRVAALVAIGWEAAETDVVTAINAAIALPSGEEQARILAHTAANWMSRDAQAAWD